MNELEVLNCVAEKFGLTPEEVVENWIAEGKISADFLHEAMDKAGLENPLLSVNFKQPEIILPGMFYYAKENLISPDIIEGLQVSGVVGYVDDSGKHGLIVGLEEAAFPWSDKYFEIGMPWDVSGREATKQILAAAREQGGKAEAAQWCVSYAFDGISEGSGFLPSVEEWKKIVKNFEVVNVSLERANACILNGVYWSSSENSIDYSYAWLVRPSDGSTYYNYKSDTYRVRCVLAF